MPEPRKDLELQAIQGVLKLLSELDDAARERVVQYVFERLGIRNRALGIAESALSTGAARLEAPSSTTAPVAGAENILSLREKKQPRNAVEMASLVAYYL
ncbi:MAG TPA: hypothetical protein VMK12_19370, partial [Anaeromyxobacteraceae bacterium]|nr:hypothetical protein [Anaeromyxobacteraceae bacterium]